jgi:hypothetical protein
MYDVHEKKVYVTKAAEKVTQEGSGSFGYPDIFAAGHAICNT